MENKVLYRCNFEIANSGCAETYADQEIEISYQEFKVIKETPMCYWIETPSAYNKVHGDYRTGKRLVHKDPDGKRFAYLEKSDALRGLLHRRLSYRARLKQQVKNNDRLIEIIKKLNPIY